MPAQAETRPRSADIGDQTWNQRVMTGLLPIWILMVCVFSGLSGARVYAEEAPALFPSITTVSLNLTLLNSFSLRQSQQTMRLDFDSRFTSTLKGLAAERDGKGAVSKAVLRKQLIWPSEGPRAKVRPGFGEFFHDETVEPLRSSGAGVEDSRYLYVKFSFRF